MPRLAVVTASSDRARRVHDTLAEHLDLVEPAECDVLVVLGGDGTLIDALHSVLAARRRSGRTGGPAVYGANHGTTGFLLNGPDLSDLPDRVAAAVPAVVRPLRFRADGPYGPIEGHAFNEVAMRRSGSQVASLRVLIDGQERLAECKGDGLLVATPAGSTGYNQAAGGAVLPLGCGLVSLTPVCVLRPRRWRGALLSDADTVRVEVQDGAKRPVAASGDQRGLHAVEWVEVTTDVGAEVTLLFERGRTLEDRSLAEQFAP